jgi:hypothetical protein
MIAAKRRRNRLTPAALARRVRRAPQSARRAVRQAPQNAAALTRKVDRAANRLLVRAHPVLVRWRTRARALAARTVVPFARRLSTVGARLGRRLWALLRPLVRVAFRLLAVVERLGRRLGALVGKAVARASAAITPQRAICGVAFAMAVGLLVSQFVDYHGVEVGQPGYAGLPATAPAVDVKWAGAAHAYVLVPVALLAAGLAFLGIRRDRRGLGRPIFLLGLLSLAVILIVDLPSGLDAGVQAAQFSGATGVLYGGFYGELACAAGLMLAGMLLVLAPKAAARYHARPCRTRINLYARAASALRRRRRRRASSRGRAARRRSRRRNGEVSAPASRP